MEDSKNELMTIPSELSKRYEEIDKMKEEVDESKRKAELAKENADKTKEKKVTLFNKGEQIRDIKENLTEIASNQADFATFIQKIVTIQAKQSETMRFTLWLGLSNLASNRATVRFLKERLEKGEGKKLSELEKEEILSTIKLLKDQEDIFIKQQQSTARIKENTQKISKLENDISSLNNNLNKSKRRNTYLIILTIISLLIGLSGLVVSVIALLK